MVVVGVFDYIILSNVRWDLVEDLLVVEQFLRVHLRRLVPLSAFAHLQEQEVGLFLLLALVSLLLCLEFVDFLFLRLDHLPHYFSLVLLLLELEAFLLLDLLFDDLSRLPELIRRSRAFDSLSFCFLLFLDFNLPQEDLLFLQFLLSLVLQHHIRHLFHSCFNSLHPRVLHFLLFPELLVLVLLESFLHLNLLMFLFFLLLHRLMLESLVLHNHFLELLFLVISLELDLLRLANNLLLQSLEVLLLTSLLFLSHSVFSVLLLLDLMHPLFLLSLRLFPHRFLLLFFLLLLTLDLLLLFVPVLYQLFSFSFFLLPPFFDLILKYLTLLLSFLSLFLLQTSHLFFVLTGVELHDSVPLCVALQRSTH